MPIRKTWVSGFDQGYEEISTWHSKVHDKTRIRNYAYSRNNSGQIMGIRYEKVDKILEKSPTDYLRFLLPKSNGITALGMKLFQRSIESYVYSVLGSQAQTRWSIVGEGAKSLQTQDVFRKLFRDTIAQDDVTVSIRNMRKAIADTNVVLNLAIIPGVVLVPSSMIIQQTKLAGYNNILTVAALGMKFGEDSELNYVSQVKDDAPIVNVPVVDTPTPVSNPVVSSTTKVYEKIKERGKHSNELARDFLHIIGSMFVIGSAIVVALLT